MAQKVKLRLYDARDEDEVLELWRRTWKDMDPKIDHGHQLDTWFRVRWKSKLVPKTTVVVARMYTKIVGFFTVDRTSGSMDQVIVAPEQRGKGIGGEFMNEAKRLSPHYLEREVSTYNVRARSFYNKHGFVHARHMVNAYGKFVSLMHWRT